jgi:hypothetical protein
VTLIIVNLLLNVAAALGANCELAIPPAEAGETQAHGVILYSYPRSQTIDEHYNGCQSQWFLDDDHYRKLSIVRYKKGVAVAYDNIDLNGKIGYHCQYADQVLSGDSDSRCPDFGQLKKKSFQAGCYSQSKLNASDSYEAAYAGC